MYDRGHSKIGFWKTNCSELWERLHISGSPPLMPSAPNRENSTTEIPPTSPPAEAPQYGLPGMLTKGLQVSLYATLYHCWCLQMVAFVFFLLKKSRWGHQPSKQTLFVRNILEKPITFSIEMDSKRCPFTQIL